MVKLLTPDKVDLEQEEVDLVMTRAEEDAANRSVAVAPGLGTTTAAGDLSDGGMVGGVRVTPMVNGVKQAQGRAAARMSWMWDGTPSVLSLKYDPSGKSHDGAKPYLLKRHCLCCGHGGFRGSQCPNCVRNQCVNCKGSTTRGKIIPNFYLRKEDVPFPQKIFGPVDCFLQLCTRRGAQGFKSEEEMRMHARNRHRQEYQAHMDALASQKTDQVAMLERRIDGLMAAIAQSGGTVPQPTPTRQEGEAARELRRQADAARMAKARAARKPKTAVTPSIPAAAMEPAAVT